MSLLTDDTQLQPLTGKKLLAAGMILAAANFVAVLDMTIANVSVPNIAGSMGVSGTEGTYVITSYAVAEAITVPLTGWLAHRFGTVRVFITSMLMFGLCSLLCGLATSLPMLVAFRVLQGLSGGPLMPLSQTILLRIFPPEKRAAAIGLWSMTTLVAPIMGPILGGVICDNYSWPMIFYINVPVALACAYMGWNLLKRYETVRTRETIDGVGLGMLILWVGALQLMLDEGNRLDWFNSPYILTLGIISAITFAAFLIWELTEKAPIVDLRVFRHRGYRMSVLTICLAFGAFFSAIVLTPLWLQQYMGYTARDAGNIMALSGILAVLTAPFVAVLSTKMDPRPLVFTGVMWMGLVTLARSSGTTSMGFWDVGGPMLAMGIGLPLFFIPLTGLALGSVEPREIASAAGLMNFARTLFGAIATSLVTTGWANSATHLRSEVAGSVDRYGSYFAALQSQGFSAEQARGIIDRLVQEQAIMLSTNHMFQIAAVSFLFAACMVWLAPRPTHEVDMTAVH